MFVGLCNYLCVLGAASLRARPGVMYSRGEARGNVDVLKRKFDEFCFPRNEMSVENNPFFTCVQRVGATMARERTHTYTQTTTNNKQVCHVTSIVARSFNSPS